MLSHHRHQTKSPHEYRLFSIHAGFLYIVVPEKAGLYNANLYLIIGFFTSMQHEIQHWTDKTIKYPAGQTLGGMLLWIVVRKFSYR